MVAERGDADAQDNTRGSVDYGALNYIITRLFERAESKSRGADVVIEFNSKTRIWMRKSILAAAEIIKGDS